MSKFDKIFEAREQSAEGEEQPSKPKFKSEAAAQKKVKNEKRQPPRDVGVLANENSVQKQRGRPKAKRSDPNFIGFTTYIRKETHKNVKIALLQEGNGRELSELVEDLLARWIKR